MRQLERAARVKRRDEWDRIAFLRYELRKTFCKDRAELSYVDFNPILTKEERAEHKAKERERKAKSAPEIGARELYETLQGATAPRK